MVMGLTTGIWVSAQVRLCDRAFIPATIVRHGNDEAGTVLVKINRFEQGVTVFAQATSLDGEPAWSRGTGPKPVTEAEAPEPVTATCFKPAPATEPWVAAWVTCIV